MTRWIREAALWLGAVVGALTFVVAIAVVGFGYSLLVFRSGSMEPAISTGALALATSVDAADIRVGDVVSVRAASGTRVTHRVVDVQLDGQVAKLTLKGDANRSADDETYPVTSTPRVVMSVPGLGYAAAQLFSPPGLLAAGAIGAGLLWLGFRSDDDRGAGRRRRGRAVTTVASAAVLVGGIGMTDAFFTDPATAATTNGSARYFTCANAEVGLNPWAYYDFDDASTSTSTTVVDGSGNSNTATWRNILGLTRGVTRACGRDTGSAIRLNGTSNYASSSANIVASNGAAGARWNVFTVNVWFKTTATTSMGNLISMGSAATGGSGNHDRHLILRADGRLAFGVYPGSLREVTSPTGKTYNDNQWHMATASLSTAGMKLYVDGQLVASRTDTTTAEQPTAMYWRIGYDTTTDWGGSPPNPYFGGTMDELSIYTRALSDTEVTQLFRSALPTA